MLIEDYGQTLTMRCIQLCNGRGGYDLGGLFGHLTARTCQAATTDGVPKTSRRYIQLVKKCYLYSKAHARHATKLSNFVACLTWQIAQLLTSHATNFLDINHLYS